MRTIQEICDKQINDFRDFIIDEVKESFDKEGEARPLVYALIFKENGEPAIAVLDGLGELFKSPEGKEMAAEVIRKTTAHLKPIALAFASEAWIAKVDAAVLTDENGNLKKDAPTAAELTSKVESLFVSIETFASECIKMWKISDDAGKRTLVEFDESDTTEWQPKQRKIATLFGDLLAENYNEMTRILETQLKVNPN
jgi:hypothetical protein